MKTINQPLSYTDTEIRSFLPTGWDIVGDGKGTWDSKKRTWQVSVLDNVEFDWPVVVKADDVTSLGRMEALRRAMNAVYRERLG